MDQSPIAEQHPRGKIGGDGNFIGGVVTDQGSAGLV
jgi:hypothetical protein